MKIKHARFIYVTRGVIRLERISDIKSIDYRQLKYECAVANEASEKKVVHRTFIQKFIAFTEKLKHNRSRV